MMVNDTLKRWGSFLRLLNHEVSSLSWSLRSSSFRGFLPFPPLVKDKDCKSLGSVQGYSDVRIKAKQWMDGDTSHTYSHWKAMAPTKSKVTTGESRSEARKRHLMEKYGRKWKERTKRNETSDEQDLREEEWLRQVLFTPSNRAAREMACTMIESLCQVNVQIVKTIFKSGKGKLVA